MSDVITLSSDSESEVEILGSYSNYNELLPLSSVRIEVDTLNIKTPLNYIDLTDTKGSHTEFSIFLDPSAPLDTVDLTEDDLKNDREHNLPSDCQKGDTITNTHWLSVKPDFKSQDKFPRDSEKVVKTTQVLGDLKPQQRLSRSQRLTIKESICNRAASVVLKKLDFLENHIIELKTSAYIVKTDGKTMSLHPKQQHSSSTSGCTDHLLKATQSNSVNASVETKQPQQVQQINTTTPLPPCSQADSSHLQCQISQPTSAGDELNASVTIPSSTSTLTSLDKAKSSMPKEIRSFSPSLPIGASALQPEIDRSRNSSLHCTPAFCCNDSHSCPNPKSGCIKLTEPISVKLDTYEDDYELDSPLSFTWEDSREEEELDGSSADVEEDRHYICPVALRSLRFGDAQVLIDHEERSNKPQMLCRRSLSLVYTTVDESYPEGTLQLLSDLLQPGYYPPKDITSHLIHGILLEPQSPHHICVQAYILLMRTQRHHIVDKFSVAWDWELLSSVMEKQEHHCEVVRMFLDYVVQTLKDDFEAKQATSGLYQSITKAVLSFDQQFPHIRDICKWLFSAIVKSTNPCVNAKERDEHTRMVSIIQRMLSLALEVDCSPAISSAKLSQELFHMLISSVSLRAQRMLLLETMQSKLLRCKLLEHLLDYSCSVKISVPMSLRLLLHFLKNSTLAADTGDATEKWKRWEELIHLLWMLLLSYSNAMKGYLQSSKTEQRHSVATVVYKPDDKVSRPEVHEAVEAFLSRSQKDLCEALPLHVEESLTYLQDHLLDVCQC